MKKKHMLFGLMCFLGLASASKNLFSVKIKEKISRKEPGPERPAPARVAAPAPARKAPPPARKVPAPAPTPARVAAARAPVPVRLAPAEAQRRIQAFQEKYMQALGFPALQQKEQLEALDRETKAEKLGYYTPQQQREMQILLGMIRDALIAHMTPEEAEAALLRAWEEERKAWQEQAARFAAEMNPKAMHRNFESRILLSLPRAAAPVAGADPRVRLTPKQFAQIASIRQTSVVSCAYQSVFNALMYLDLFRRKPDFNVRNDLSMPQYTEKQSIVFKNLFYNILYQRDIAAGVKKAFPADTLDDPEAPHDEELRGGLRALYNLKDLEARSDFFIRLVEKGVDPFGHDLLNVVHLAADITVLPLDMIGKFCVTLFNHKHAGELLTGGILAGIPQEDIMYLLPRLEDVAVKFGRGEHFMHAFIFLEHWEQAGLGHYGLILVGNNARGRFCYVLDPLNRPGSYYGPSNFPYGSFADLYGKDPAYLMFDETGGVVVDRKKMEGNYFLEVLPALEIIAKTCFEITLPEVQRSILPGLLPRVRFNADTRLRRG